MESLVEGIDVPDADVGVSVASSSSVRQRIQTLGRVLRRKFDGEDKSAEMHLLYAHDTVDEAIYGKEDWSDLTGADANRYWLHPLDPDAPAVEQPGPPLEPRPTEDAEWQRLGEQVPEPPEIWRGVLPDLEFSVDTRGNAATADGTPIENAQGVAAMVEKIRGRPGGRFRVTPVHSLVIVFGESETGMVPYLAGRLAEPLRARAAENETRSPIADVSELSPGSLYPGIPDESMGTYKLRQKRGGSIERRKGSVVQFAETEGADRQAENARSLITAWQRLGMSGMTFHVNSQGHAWYRVAGEPRFLANVPEGFRWPDGGIDASTSK